METFLINAQMLAFSFVISSLKIARYIKIICCAHRGMSLKVRNRRATVLNSWWEYEPKPSRDLLSQFPPRDGLRICFATQIRSICKPRRQLAPRACREFYLDVAASWNVLSYSAKCMCGSLAFADSFRTTVRKGKKCTSFDDEEFDIAENRQSN